MTKLFNIMFSNQLSRKFSEENVKITSISVHPVFRMILITIISLKCFKTFNILLLNEQLIGDGVHRFSELFIAEFSASCSKARFKTFYV